MSSLSTKGCLVAVVDVTPHLIRPTGAVDSLLDFAKREHEEKKQDEVAFTFSELHIVLHGSMDSNTLISAEDLEELAHYGLTPEYHAGWLDLDKVDNAMGLVHLQPDHEVSIDAFKVLINQMRTSAVDGQWHTHFAVRGNLRLSLSEYWQSPLYGFLYVLLLFDWLTGYVWQWGKYHRVWDLRAELLQWTFPRRAYRFPSWRFLWWVWNPHVHRPAYVTGGVKLVPSGERGDSHAIPLLSRLITSHPGYGLVPILCILIPLYLLGSYPWWHNTLMPKNFYLPMVGYVARSPTSFFSIYFSIFLTLAAGVVGVSNVAFSPQAYQGAHILGFVGYLTLYPAVWIFMNLFYLPKALFVTRKNHRRNKKKK